MIEYASVGLVVSGNRDTAIRTLRADNIKVRELHFIRRNGRHIYPLRFLDFDSHVIAKLKYS